MKIQKISTLSYLVLFLLFSPFANALETVRIEKSVTIDRPIEEVCEFVTNPMNDYLWRNEVNAMLSTDEEVGEGVIYTEDAWIGIRRNFITITELAEYNCPDFATFITIDENPFYLKSHRSFESVDSKHTKFTYTVDFDVGMIKKTFGFNISPKIARNLYSIQMLRYLNNLRRLFKSSKK